MDCVVYRKVRGAPSIHWVQNVLKRIEQQVPAKSMRESRLCAILFVGDTRMRTLNRVYHGTDRPTDVLAFPPSDTFSEAREGSVGDVVVNVPYVRRQALRFGVPFQAECARMLTHGVLHLLGYTHDKRLSADKMFRLQETIVNAILA